MYSVPDCFSYYAEFEIDRTILTSLIYWSYTLRTDGPILVIEKLCNEGNLVN